MDECAPDEAEPRPALAALGLTALGATTLGVTALGAAARGVTATGVTALGATARGAAGGCGSVMGTPDGFGSAHSMVWGRKGQERNIATWCEKMRVVNSAPKTYC